MACKDLNCTPSDYVIASTDISGWGVRTARVSVDDKHNAENQALAAFLTSALLTVLAILYGYLSDSLPDVYLNETDRAIIDYFQRRPRWLHRMVSFFGFPLVVYRKISRRIQSDPSNPESTHIGRQKREEAVTKFVLALSDQQLATGLAVIIGAMANQCTLTHYDFNMTFSLAWFSATTHLATLDCLRDYFEKHRTV